MQSSLVSLVFGELACTCLPTGGRSSGEDHHPMQKPVFEPELADTYPSPVLQSKCSELIRGDIPNSSHQPLPLASSRQVLMHMGLCKEALLWLWSTRSCLRITCLEQRTCPCVQVNLVSKPFDGEQSKAKEELKIFVKVCDNQF